MISIALAPPRIMTDIRFTTVKRWTLPALWLALVFQAIWMTGAVFPPPKDGELGAFDIVVVAIAGALAMTAARVPWLAAMARIWIGIMLVGSVADRFGLLGEPGAAGVSWGNWSNFVDYTRDVTTFLPSGLAPSLAVLATIAELLLGIGLLLGVRIRWMAAMTTALLATYGLSMSISLGADSTFPYNVWVLSAASLVMTSSDASPFSIDRRRQRTPAGA